MTEHTVNPLESALSFLFPSSFEIFVKTARDIHKNHFPQSVKGLQKLNVPMLLCNRLCGLKTCYPSVPASVFTALAMDEIFDMADMSYQAKAATEVYLRRQCAHIDAEVIKSLRADVRELVMLDWSSDIERLRHQSMPLQATNKPQNIRSVRPVFFRALAAAC